MTKDTTNENYTERKLFTYEERCAVLKSTGGICACCGQKLTTKTMTIEHIIPIYRGGTNDMENLTALCPECNKRKNNLIFLPESFYIALTGTPRIRKMEQYTRQWLKSENAREIDIEMYPMIAPEHYMLITRRNMRPVFSKQLLYKWCFIGDSSYDEAQAITGISLQTVRKFISRPLNLEDPEKSHYRHPVPVYVLKKASTDRYLALLAIQYDKEREDLILYLAWKDKNLSPGGRQQIFTLCLSRIFDSIINLAEKNIRNIMCISEYDKCLDGLSHPYIFGKYANSGVKWAAIDTIDNKTIYTLSMSRIPGCKPKQLHEFIEMPHWLQYPQTSVKKEAI